MLATTNLIRIINFLTLVNNFFIEFQKVSLKNNFPQIFGTPGAVYVRRRVGEAYDPQCVVPTVKFGGGSVMVWGCMASSGTGLLFTCDGRMNSNTYTTMLDQVYQPSLGKMFNNNIPDEVIFQQDNAPCHTSRVSRGWFEEREVRVMNWPPQSPDLNPIEHLWAHLGTRVRMYKCSSQLELKAKLHEEWQKIEPTICLQLVSSVQKRIKAVIKAKGKHINY